MNEHDDRNIFKTRVQKWATKLDVPVKTVSLRQMRNKWASYSTSGRLNFNTELLQYEPDIIDYVIVHELLHASVPNHGKLWKSLMVAYLGDYQSLEKRLHGLSTMDR